MKRAILMTAALALLVGCAADKVITLPDHKEQIDSNTARILLLEANDELQDLRLDSLDIQAADLQARLLQAEDDIDVNESDIAALLDEVGDLDSGLEDLRDELRDSVRDLRRADRSLRRDLRRQASSLRRSLVREIRSRRLADARLQRQIDDVEQDLQSFEASQAAINRFLAGGIFLTNLRISQLQRSISYSLRNLDRRLDRVEGDIDDINSEISDMQALLSSMRDDIDDVEASVVSVVYPCGEGNSQEILLQTQDGLVAYFQQVRNETETFSVGSSIPEHFICDRFVGQGNICVRGHNVPASTASQSVTITHQVLKKAYLDVLDDGSYGTTDGHSCNFTISNGEVQ